MADRRTIRQNIKRLQAVRTWQLCIILILTVVVAATFLRMNNTGMVARRNAVTAADKSGDQAAITNRIYDLQKYSASHMNASTGVLYLQEQYNRDTKRALEASSSTSSDMARANAEAEAVCHPQFYGYSTAYLRCFVDELAKHPAASKLPEASLPNPALYRYNVISPVWSADFAGFSVVACVVIALVILARLISLTVLRILLKRHYRET